MTVICIVTILGITAANDCTLLSERYGGWEVACQGQVMSLPEYRCVYANGQQRNVIVNENDSQYDDLMRGWGGDEWQELRLL